ncbi:MULTISPECIES: DNA-binding protein [Halolamina]|uniref:DNA-binding protein SAMN05216277_103284 n=1 Tax=Halolamina pelagica TaxID=699431 RepID=A0A1I5Q813_9EURY|nr:MULTISPECIES: DNA-binding protein [Halolamina]NHX35124.1 DNA-binding protein [Halolamina sp. R1-12]SFP42016.1 DNA-binding TFAR19-related protein [Halolamina pelagica]
MSGNPDEDRIEQLRQERLEELQDQAGDEEAQQAAQEQQERAKAQQDALLKQYLTDDARQRLNAVEMSKPEFAEKVKQQVTALAQSGRLQGKIDEDRMKEILRELKPDEKSFDIRRR